MAWYQGFHKPFSGFISFIPFYQNLIDMSDQKHIHAVEKRLKEATSRDRARIQVGHISQFGLLEMSRQRLRPSLMETNSSVCQHCRGTGLVRSVESMSLLVIRAIENEGIEGRSSEIVATVPSGVDLYLLNQKRSSLIAVESRYQMHVIIARDDTIMSPDFRIESLNNRKAPQNLPQLQPLPLPEPVDEEESEVAQTSSQRSENEEKISPHHAPQGEGSGRRRRRRRPFSKRRDHDHHRDQNQTDQPSQAPSSKDDQSRSSASIEEQIVTEIMGGAPRQQAKNPSGKLSSQEDNKGNEKSEEAVKEGGSGEHPRRRRRRGRRNSQRGSQQQGGSEDNTSSASPVEQSGQNKVAALSVLPEEKALKSIEGSKPKSKDISIPMTSLPEGAESSSKKSPHGRWWKRLLES